MFLSPIQHFLKLFILFYIRCETHNEQLSVFCMSCNSTICHRCALFDNSAHNGHSFRPVEDIYNETIAQLGESCDNLKTKEELIKKDIKELVCILM